MRFEFLNLSFAWPGEGPLFEGVDIRIDAGERLSILGGNGSGKSTLARCLSGRLACRDGILCDGRPWTDRTRHEQAAMVQCVAQRPHLQLSGRGQTLREEVAFGPENLCLPAGEIVARVEEALTAVGLTHLAGRDCRRLSGGEMQRAVLAGALAMRPALLVLDEPMTDLDADSRDRLATYLRELPWRMALIVLDIGWHGWMDGLVTQHRVLSRGRLSRPVDTGLLLGQNLPPEILLPDAVAGTPLAQRAPALQGHP